MTENNDGQYDLTSLKQVKEHGQHLKQMYSARDKLMAEMENLYFMRWEEEGRVVRQVENVKVTKTPNARNKALGAIRLLTAADPTFSVPSDINNPLAVSMADKLEKFCQAMWFAAGRIAGDPIHYDVVRSAVLYDTICIAVTSTKDLLDYSGNSPSLKYRAEQVYQRTPYLFEVLQPQGVYPDFGKLGMNELLITRKVTRSYICDYYGEMGEAALATGKYNKNPNPYDMHTLNSFFDMKKNVVYLDECERPILMKEHGLPCIPIVVQTAAGSKLFTTPEEQIEPFLLTLWRSGLINRQNLLLTVLYTMTFAIGANPLFVFQGMTADRDLTVDMTRPGGVVKLGPGERFDSLAKQVIDPSIMQSWQISQDLEAQSTLYSAALGEPLGQYANYSMMALLNQSGRLPLLPIQRKASDSIGKALEITLHITKHDKTTGRVSYDNNEYVLEPDDIPDRFEIKANLDISLPQDKLNSANIANMLAAGDNPLVDKGWVRENILGIGQSDDMTKSIWDEKMAELFYRRYIMTEMAKLAQMEQAAMQPPTAASGVPGMPQAPGGMPPGQGTPPMMEMQGFGQPQEPLPPEPPMIPPQMEQQ